MHQFGTIYAYIQYGKEKILRRIQYEYLCKMPNHEICGKSAQVECEHFDISFTRSEVVNMIKSADESRKQNLLHPIEQSYGFKLAF